MIITDKPPAFIHVDVDSDRSLGNFYQHRDVQTNVVYEQGFPRARNFISRFSFPTTFFVCGSDLSSPLNRSLVKDLSRYHEVANHTFSHPNGFRGLSSLQQTHEIQRNTVIIKAVTGKTPVGFRAPGYDVDKNVLRNVARSGYLYDSSYYPSILHPFLRWFLLMKWKRSVDPGYGSSWNAFTKTSMYHIQLGGTSKDCIWEVPVSVFPLLRLPIHSNIAMHFPDQYVLSAISLLSHLKRPLVFLFHAIEFVDRSDRIDSRLFVHPSFRLSLEKKLRHFTKILAFINKNFSVYRTDQYLMNLM